MKLVWSRLSAAAIISTCALITATVAFAGAEASGGPRNGVWTCGYIAKHPAEAAAAFVSCDPRGPVTVRGVAPVDPPLSTLSPCGRVPASGGVSQGVYAWTQNYHYFNYFSYSPAVVQLFTWYVQKQNGSNVQWGQDTQTNSRSVTAGANYYRWGARNDGSSVQHWIFCWSIQ